jgi:hypothetical protein
MLENVYDEWGRVRCNADGTFYPGDAFKINYSVSTDEDTTFDGLTVEYDVEIFKATGTKESPHSIWNFEIKKTAKPGEYPIVLTARGTYTYTITYTVTVCEKVRRCEWRTDPEGHKYMLCWWEEECRKEERMQVVHESVSASKTIIIKIVPYEPKLTVVATYLALKYGGASSFEKPFAIIVRYDGTPVEEQLLGLLPITAVKYTFDRRVLIEDYSWKGEARKIVYDQNRRDLTEVIKSLEDFDANFTSLKWVNRLDAPIILQSDKRYAKILLKPDAKLMGRVLGDKFTDVWFKVSFMSNSFTPYPYTLFTAEYTYLPEVYGHPIVITAYKPQNNNMVIDNAVHIKAEFTPAKLSYKGKEATVQEIYKEWIKTAIEHFREEWPKAYKEYEEWLQQYGIGLEKQESPKIDDLVAQKMYEEDVEGYGSDDIQIFEGIGKIEAQLLRTSPILYSMTLMVKGHGKEITIKRITSIPFGGQEPFKIYVNLIGGGVGVKKAYETRSYCYLKLNALPEAGGLTRVAIYNEDGNIIYVEKLQPAIISPQNFGFYGEHTITFQKTSQTSKIITVEVENLWNVETRIPVMLKPYEPLLIATDQLTYGLTGLLVAIVVLSVMRLLFRGFKSE